jgi:thioredoxin 1
MNTVFYFTADWCNPCKKVRPIVEEINRDSFVKFQIIDVDSEPELVKRFEIRSVPTFILMKNNQEASRITGAQTKQGLLDFINVELEYNND